MVQWSGADLDWLPDFLIHEYAHHIQYELSNDLVVSTPDGMALWWAGMSWDAAFETTFGMTLADYGQDFELFKASYGKARRFSLGQDWQ